MELLAVIVLLSSIYGSLGVPPSKNTEGSDLLFTSVVVQNSTDLGGNGGGFKKIADGIADEWKKADPKNAQRFALRYGNNTLWLVSRRPNYENLPNAKRGGIVSTLPLPKKEWSHKPFEQLGDSAHDDYSFSLGGHLFLLTYSNQHGNAKFEKLFSWNDESGAWQDVKFEIDPKAISEAKSSFSDLVIDVPNPAGKEAYITLSGINFQEQGSELSFSKLEIEFQGNNPVKASLKSIAHHKLEHDSFGVAFTALKGSKLLAFVRRFTTDGAFGETDFAFTIDLESGAVGNVTLTGTPPPQNYEKERAQQVQEKAVYIFGGSRPFGLGQSKPVEDVWSLDLDKLEWRATPLKLHDHFGEVVLTDGTHVYLAGLEEGVFVAQLPA